MELGGSDPFIVLPDAPLEAAVDAALLGRLFNTGQSCISAKRIIVVGNERGAAFLELFTRKASTLQPGDPTEMTPRLGPLSSQRAPDGLKRGSASCRERECQYS